MARKKQNKVETAHRPKTGKELDAVSAYKRINEEYLLVTNTTELVELLKEVSEPAGLGYLFGGSLQFITGELKQEINKAAAALLAHLDIAEHQLRFEAKKAIKNINQ